jgi:hypothetical protein
VPHSAGEPQSRCRKLLLKSWRLAKAEIQISAVELNRRQAANRWMHLISEGFI